MTYKEANDKIAALINDPIALSDFKSKGLNWVHPVRVFISWSVWSEFIKQTMPVAEDAPAGKKEDAAPPKLFDVLKQKLVYWVGKVSLLKRILRFTLDKIANSIYTVKHLFILLGFFLRAFYLRLLRKNKTLNLSFDHYDAVYGGQRYNAFCDNINLNEETLKICFLIWGKADQVKQARYKPWVLGKTFNAYGFFFPADKMDRSFLLPLEKILDKSALDYVGENLWSIYKYHLFFTFLLKVLRPNRVFLYDSYNIYTLGIISAAKKQGVQTIEQQHGVISPMHFGYSYKYTDEGQADFICDQLNYYIKPLMDWTSKDWKLHPKLVNINVSPAIQLWEKFRNVDSNSRLKALKARRSGLKVVTIGLTNQLLPPWLVDFLLSHSKDYFFCFRLHPRYSAFNKHQVEGLCKKLQHCDFEISSSITLFDLFEISDFFLSDGSTTLIESLSFDLKAICTSEHLAQERFRPYIEEKFIFPAGNEAALEKILLSNDSVN